ncbi:MAG: DUF4147 domain-containing protein, partial [Thermoguttaceae bacterium]|nr:DUF4147 domain-containing protein [Thermoguttaceae bacterium]
SGGGSALFEKPLLPEDEIAEITCKLLAVGANIIEINTLRKRFSAVKGGKFGKLCAPARVFSIVLSDVIGDSLDAIASGPAYPDATTAADARAVVAKYSLQLSPRALGLLDVEMPKILTNVETRVVGSARLLCAAALEKCRELGYRPVLLTDRLQCEAREAGRFLAAIARTHADSTESLAFIAGGETVVRLTGNGLGGRNQELALAAAPELAGLDHCAVFSVGSDGSDGPTDAAGGIATGETAAKLAAAGFDVDSVLKQNDSYRALDSAGALIRTGPTGTNVNDFACALIRGKAARSSDHAGARVRLS